MSIFVLGHWLARTTFLQSISSLGDWAIFSGRTDMLAKPKSQHASLMSQRGRG